MRPRPIPLNRIKFVLLTIGLVALSAYAFVLGHLQALSVPEAPSMQATLAFFIRTLSAPDYTALPSPAGYSPIILPLAVLLLILSVICLRKGSLVAARLSLGAGLVLCIGSAFLAHNRALYLCAAVLLPVAGALVIYWALSLLLNHTNARWDRGWTVPAATLAVAGLVLTAPYCFGVREIQSAVDLNERFSPGFTESSQDSMAYLLWVDNGRYFWLSCDLGTIYGDWGGQQVFYETEIPDDLIDKFCGDESAVAL